MVIINRRQSVLRLEEKSKENHFEHSDYLKECELLDCQLFRHFEDKFLVHPSLSRQLVSFQANKNEASYRWYKFKEAFSASLVHHFLSHNEILSGKLLDPFAGSGTALFAASSVGLDADGIELLPIGQEIIEARNCSEKSFTKDDFFTLKRWYHEKPWNKSPGKILLPILRITEGAYPPETVEAIERYMKCWELENPSVQLILKFALLCVVESVSYTSKDGQYLRWDYRSGKGFGLRPFKKKHILNFDQAICMKLNEILVDLESDKAKMLWDNKKRKGSIILFKGSCLEKMSSLPGNNYDVIITSPPYCNRYDYTRTYALELALLGITEKEMIRLRQEMLSCTVENFSKDLLSINNNWKYPIEVANQQRLLQSIISYLEDQKNKGRLNNNGIPRMVKGYFYEMACVIYECSRVLKKDSLMFMVNDNVRYAGASISVDMILSDFAEKLGFEVENILVLPNGKGNSSQQMGTHGRAPLRKCVYVWRKV